MINLKDKTIELNPYEKELLNMMGDINKSNNAIFLSKLSQYLAADFNELTDDCSCLVINTPSAYAVSVFEDGWMIYLNKKYGYWRKVLPEQPNLMKEIFSRLLEIRFDENF